MANLFGAKGLLSARALRAESTRIMAELIPQGTTIGRYIVERPLGTGGMGEVHLARDTKLGRDVAIKILPTAFSTDTERLRRFEQEACAASALNHPNILTIYEINEEGGTHFIATEYIEGETLRHSIAHSTLDLHDALAIAIQIASALAAAHRAKIVHRDIKPENIMVRRDDGLVKVLDFGLAKPGKQHQDVAVDTQASTKALVNTAPGTVMGTTAYMSPEQARGLEVDERTDIWSLGCVLYEMVAGCMPFVGASSNEIISAIISKERQSPLARFAHNVPERLEEIVAKALAKDREERYQSAKDLLIDLRNLKRKIEVDAEIERSMAPELQTSDARATTNEQASHPTSSAEYLISEIKRHKRSAFVAVAAIILLSVAGIIFYLNSARTGSSRAAIDSIAVLPFANASGDSNTEYLSDGISESLINSLTELQQLRVIARATAFRYKGKEIDPQTVGRELNVRAVLMGRVRQVGDTLDIQVDLVDAQTGAQLWGQEYERKVSDVLSIKQTIAREVTEKLRLKLSGEQQQQLTKRDTTNAEAYQLYLQGDYLWYKWDDKSLEFFQRAIEKDPKFALAYIGVAESYLHLVAKNKMSAQEGIPKARDAITKALELDGTLAEAQNALAEIKYQFEYDWAGAEKDFQKALELNPNVAQIRLAYGWYLMTAGRFDEAMPQMRRAQEIDPHNRLINGAIGKLYYFMRQYDKALEQYQNLLVLEPNDPNARGSLVNVYEQKGMYAEAVEEQLKNASINNGLSPEEIEESKEAFRVSGWRGFLQIRRARMEERAKKETVLPTNVALLYARLGDKDRAFAWLEKAFDVRDPSVIRLKIDPVYDSLRSDPRYTKLLERMNLQP